ncbi:GNAT family N-acetyltransferase [Bacteroides clarus]|uniref:GNAT family N-acetyltransferase n=1 Tax=Bacteroides clarus TaxID=626929 RepID=UPI002100B1E8|nr:GNAT family N-acetyltransferase [Bacteroides clarus]MCQ1547169.1 GNAT family N-acetyltransferase [Bacteroides clarus]
MEIEKLQFLSDKILDELLIVWENSVRSSHHFLKEEDIEYFKPLVRNQYFPAVKLFVIRNEDERIAAFMGLSDDMLEMLFVLPEEQGKGYGKVFVDYAINKCNIYKVDVNEDNERAYRFYLHMGYKVIGRNESDSSGKPFPILHLQHP